MEEQYTSIMQIESNEEREVKYNTFLFNYFGYDILRANGHDLTNPRYWRDKFRNRDYSDPMHNPAIYQMTLLQAEEMYHEYTQYKYRYGFNMSSTIQTINDMFGQQLDEHMFNQINTYLNEEIAEMPYDEYMKQVRAGLMAAHMQAIYDPDGNMMGFIGNDGTLRSVMTKEEYDRAGEPKGVYVLQPDGDLVLNDVSGIRQIAGSFGQGVVRSVYDVGSFFAMMGFALTDLIDYARGDDPLEFRRMTEVYQSMEAFANQFAWGGRPLRYNMDGSKGWNDINTWIGVSRFAGQIGATVALAMATGGAGATGIVGMVKGKGATKAVQKVTAKTLKAKAATFAKGAARKSVNVAGRIHGVYMGNPYGNMPAQTIAQVIKKRGMFAATYAARDSMTTYTTLRTLEVDHDEAFRRAQLVFGINTAVAFFFTGGIDDSPTRDYQKVLSKVFTRPVPPQATVGKLGNRAFGRLVAADVFMDTIDNYVTMATDQYFKNPDAEVSFDEWMDHMLDFWKDPQSLMSVATISWLGARGSRRVHQSGFDVPARTFDALVKRFESESQNTKNTPEQRASATRLADKLHKDFRDNLQKVYKERGITEQTDLDSVSTKNIIRPTLMTKGDEAGITQASAVAEAIMMTLENAHRNMADNADNSIVQRTLNEHVSENKVRVMREVHDTTASIMKQYSDNNTNIMRDVFRHGFFNTAHNNLRKMFTNRTERDINIQRASRFIQQSLGIRDEYRGTEEQQRIINQETMRALMGGKSTYEDPGKLTEAESDALERNVTINKLDDYSGEYKAKINKELGTELTGDYVVVHYPKDSKVKADNAIIEKSRRSAVMLSDVYREAAPEGMAMLYRLDNETFLIRMEYADTPTKPGAYAPSVKPLLVLEQMRAVTIALRDISTGTDMDAVRKALTNLHALLVAPKEDFSELTPKHVLEISDMLVKQGFMKPMEVVAMMRSFNADYKAYGEPEHIHVQTLRLVDLYERIEQTTSPVQKTILQGELNQVVQELKSNQQKLFTEAQLDAYKRRAAERSLRRGPEIDQAFELIKRSSPDLSDNDLNAILEYAYTKTAANRDAVLKLAKNSRDAADFVSRAEKAGYIRADLVGAMRSRVAKKRTAPIDINSVHHAGNRLNLLINIVQEKAKVNIDAMNKLNDIVKDNAKNFEKDGEKYLLSLLPKALKGDKALQAEILKDYRSKKRAYNDIQTEQYYSKLFQDNKHYDEMYHLLDPNLSDQDKLNIVKQYMDVPEDVSGQTIFHEKLDKAKEILHVDKDVLAQELITAAFDRRAQDEVNMYRKNVKSMEDYHTENVKMIENNKRRLVIDLNKVLPNKLYRILQRVDHIQQVNLVQNLRKSDKTTSSGLVTMLKSHGFSGDIGKALVREINAYQQLLRQYRTSDGFIVFDDIRRSSEAQTIMRSLGYEEVDYMVDAEVDIPGIHTFDERVAVMPVKTKAEPRFGISQETVDNPLFFNEPFAVDHMDTFYFSEETPISPGSLAVIGRSTGRRGPAATSNNRIVSPQMKAGKTGGDAGETVGQAIPQVTSQFRYSSEALRLQVLTHTINELEKRNVFSALSTKPSAEVLQFWRYSPITRELTDSTETYYVLHSFNADKAREYVRTQLSSGKAVDPTIIIPLDSDTPRGIIKQVSDAPDALSRLGVDQTITDKIVNNDLMSLQEALYNLANDGDPQQAADLRSFDVYRSDIDAPEEQGGTIPFTEPKTIRQILIQYKDADEMSPEGQLYRYAEAALALSNGAYADYDADIAPLLSIPGVRAVLESNDSVEVKRQRIQEAVAQHNRLSRENKEAVFADYTDPDSFHKDSFISNTLNRLYNDGENHRSLTSDYLNRLSPIYSEEVSVDQVRRMMEVVDEYRTQTSRLLEPTDEPDSKMFAMMRSVDEGLPLKFIEDATDEEFAAALKHFNEKDQDMLRKKREQFNNLNKDIEMPEDTVMQEIGARDHLLPGDRTTTQTLNDPDTALNHAMIRERVKKAQRYRKTKRDRGMVKMRKLIDNLDAGNNYLEATYKYVDKHILHTGDNPSAYMMIDANNQYHATKRAFKIADTVKTLRSVVSKDISIEKLAEIAHRMYFGTTGFKYSSELDHYFLIDVNTGIIRETGKKSGGADHDALYAMIVSRQVTPDTVIVRVNKDSMLQDGRVELEMIRPYNDKGNMTNEFSLVREAANDHFYHYMLNFRLQDDDGKESATNAFRQYLQLEPGKSVPESLEIELRLGLANYLFEARGSLRSYQDMVRQEVVSMMVSRGNTEQINRVTNRIMQIMFGNIRDVQIDPTEFNAQERAILNALLVERGVEKTNRAYFEAARKSGQLDDLVDFLTFGIDLKEISSDTRMEFLQARNTIASSVDNDLRNRFDVYAADLEDDLRVAFNKRLNTLEGKIKKYAYLLNSKGKQENIDNQKRQILGEINAEIARLQDETGISIRDDVVVNAYMKYLSLDESAALLHFLTHHDLTLDNLLDLDGKTVISDTRTIEDVARVNEWQTSLDIETVPDAEGNQHPFAIALQPFRITMANGKYDVEFGESKRIHVKNDAITAEVTESAYTKQFMSTIGKGWHNSFEAWQKATNRLSIKDINKEFGKIKYLVTTNGKNFDLPQLSKFGINLNKFRDTNHTDSLNDLRSFLSLLKPGMDMKLESFLEKHTQLRQAYETKFGNIDESHDELTDARMSALVIGEVLNKGLVIRENERGIAKPLLDIAGDLKSQVHQSIRQQAGDKLKDVRVNSETGEIEGHKGGQFLSRILSVMNDYYRDRENMRAQKAYRADARDNIPTFYSRAIRTKLQQERGLPYLKFLNVIQSKMTGKDFTPEQLGALFRGVQEALAEYDNKYIRLSRPDKQSPLYQYDSAPRTKSEFMNVNKVGELILDEGILNDQRFYDLVNERLKANDVNLRISLSDYESTIESNLNPTAIKQGFSKVFSGNEKFREDLNSYRLARVSDVLRPLDNIARAFNLSDSVSFQRMMLPLNKNESADAMPKEIQYDVTKNILKKGLFNLSKDASYTTIRKGITVGEYNYVLLTQGSREALEAYRRIIGSTDTSKDTVDPGDVVMDRDGAVRMYGEEKVKQIEAQGNTALVHYLRHPSDRPASMAILRLVILPGKGGGKVSLMMNPHTLKMLNGDFDGDHGVLIGDQGEPVQRIMETVRRSQWGKLDRVDSFVESIVRSNDGILRSIGTEVGELHQNLTTRVGLGGIRSSIKDVEDRAYVEDLIREIYGTDPEATTYDLNREGQFFSENPSRYDLARIVDALVGGSNRRNTAVYREAAEAMLQAYWIFNVGNMRGIKGYEGRSPQFLSFRNVADTQKYKDLRTMQQSMLAMIGSVADSLTGVTQFGGVKNIKTTTSLGEAPLATLTQRAIQLDESVQKRLTSIYDASSEANKRALRQEANKQIREAFGKQKEDARVSDITGLLIREDVTGAEYANALVRSFELLDMARRLSAEENDAFRNVVEANEYKGLIDEVFTAEDLNNIANDAFREVFAERSQELFTQSSKSTYIQQVENAMLQSLLSKFEENASMYEDRQVGFVDKKGKARIVFMSDANLTENSMLISQDLHNNMRVFDVVAVKTGDLDPRLHEGKSVRKGQKIGLESDATAPVRGKIVKVEDGITYIRTSTKLTGDVKLGTPKTTISKGTVSDIVRMNVDNVDIVMDISNIESLKKGYPEMFDRVFKEVKTEDSLEITLDDGDRKLSGSKVPVYEVDLVVLEAFMHSKNKNDNFTYSTFGGQQEGGKIDFLTMLSNFTSQTNPLLVGRNTGENLDAMFTRGAMPFENYIQEKNPAYLDRNVARDLRTVRLLLALELTDKSVLGFDSIDIKKVLDTNPGTATVASEQLESYIKQRYNITDLAELVTDDVATKLKRPKDVQFLRSLLSNETLNLLWSKVPADLDQGGDIFGKKETPIESFINFRDADVHSTERDAVSIANDSMDPNTGSLNWRDLFTHLYQGKQYMPSKQELNALAFKGHLPLGRGYQRKLEGNYVPANSDERVDVSGLRGNVGPGVEQKSGRLINLPIEVHWRPGKKSVITPAEFRDATSNMADRPLRFSMEEGQEPFKFSSKGNENMLSFFTEALVSSIDENFRYVDGASKYSLGINKMDMALEVSGREDFTSKRTMMYPQIALDETGIYHTVRKQDYSVTPDDISDLARQRRGATTMKALEAEADDVDTKQLYRDTFESTSGKVTMRQIQTLFSKVTSRQQQANRIDSIDHNVFKREYEAAEADFRKRFARPTNPEADEATLGPSYSKRKPPKTIRSNATVGDKLENEIRRDPFLLTASGIKENDTISQQAGNVINRYGTVFNRIFSQLASGLAAFERAYMALADKSQFERYRRYMHVLTLINDTGRLHEETVMRLGSDLGFQGNVKDTLIAMEAFVHRYKNMNGIVVKQYDQVAENIYKAATEQFGTSIEARYALMYPLNLKSLPRETKQASFVSSVVEMFDPKKFSTTGDKLQQRALIDDSFESLVKVVTEVARLGAIKEFGEEAKNLGMMDSVRVLEIAEQYVSTYLEARETLSYDQSLKVLNTLVEDPHGREYFMSMRDSVLEGLKDVAYEDRASALMSRIRDTLKHAQSNAMQKLRNLLGDQDISINKLVEEPTFRNLQSLYERTDSPQIRDTVIEIMNIKKLGQEVIGFGLGQKKADAPTFSSYLANMIGDARVTDTYMRLLKNDNGRLNMKKLVESDTSYVKDLLMFRDSDQDFEFELLSRALNGEVYASNRGLADHMDRYFFTHKVQGKAMKALRQSSLFFNKFVMGNPLRLPERVFGRFVAFDFALLSLAIPKTMMYSGTAWKHLNQMRATEGKVQHPDLAAYYQAKGVGPDSSQYRDVVGRQERVKSVPGLPGKVQNWVLETTEYMSDFTRYAAFLAARDSFAEGKPIYGPAFKKRAMIDSLETNEQKAWQVVKEALPTVGDLPLLSRRMAPYMVFTSFGWGLTRTALGWMSTGRRVIEDAVVRGDTSGVYRNLLVPGMGMAGMYIMSSILLTLIGELYGVDDEEVNSWKEEQNFIDPYGTLVFGTPVTRNTWNPIQMLKNDWVRPLTEGYKGFDQFDDSDDGVHWAVFGLLNHQILSKGNPLLKMPVEVMTNHDLFGSLPIPTKDQYTMWDNVRRKVMGVVLGTSAGNTLINNLNMYDYGDDPWVEKYINSMAQAIGSEFGNSRSYKQEVKDFYKARRLIYAHMYAEDPDKSEDALTEASPLENNREQFFSNNFDSGEAVRIGRMIRQAMNTGKDMSQIHAIIYEELQRGTDISTLRSALNRNSISRLMSRIDDLESFRATLTETQWKVIESAILFEQLNFPGMTDMLPYSQAPRYRRNRVPFHRTPFTPQRRRQEPRLPWRSNYKHWMDEVQPNMGTGDPVYVQPQLDNKMGVE